jgi:hypothetical protein
MLKLPYIKLTGINYSPPSIRMEGGTIALIVIGIIIGIAWLCRCMSRPLRNNE